MVDRSAELMQGLVAKLYAIVTGNNDVVKLPRNKFVSWCTPGIPFKKEDFLFCQKGIAGSSAEETRSLQHQAWTISKIFDFVPDVGPGSGFVDSTMQQTMFASTQDTISKVYGDVLRLSKVLNNELSEAEKAKVAHLRALLSIVKKNPMGRDVTEPGPMLVAYEQYRQEWTSAADEYCNLILDAQSAQGNDAEAVRRVQAFANKNKFLRTSVEAAERNWNTLGYKNDVEEIQAYIRQVSEKSLVLYKADLQNKFERGLLTSAADGQAGDFYYTQLMPGHFAEGTGWTRFRWFSQDDSQYAKRVTSEWSAQAKVSLFGIGVRGDAKGDKEERKEHNTSSTFECSFEFTQIPIVRPWFDAGFFTLRTWTLDDAWKLSFDKEISDGADVPIGRLVAYPVTALFVRNVKLKLDIKDETSTYLRTSIEGGGSVGWGVLNLGGRYKRGSEESSLRSHIEGGEIAVDGIQLVGMINNLIPKAPNTNPNIKPEQFVGGAA